MNLVKVGIAGSTERLRFGVVDLPGVTPSEAECALRTGRRFVVDRRTWVARLWPMLADYDFWNLLLLLVPVGFLCGAVIPPIVGQPISWGYTAATVIICGTMLPLLAVLARVRRAVDRLDIGMAKDGWLAVGNDCVTPVGPAGRAGLAWARTVRALTTSQTVVDEADRPTVVESVHEVYRLLAEAEMYLLAGNPLDDGHVAPEAEELWEEAGAVADDLVELVRELGGKRRPALHEYRPDGTPLPVHEAEGEVLR